MHKYLSASVVYPVTNAPLEKGVLVLEEDGTIAAVLTAEAAQAAGIEEIEFHEGALIPGLVNTHCHLELSHLFGKIPEHTGLQGFVQEVMRNRTIAEELLLDAMERADEELLRNGVVAVGDIANIGISARVKKQSRLHYHTFIETLGFDPKAAGKVMERALSLKAEFAPLKASIVPHAPYSVSRELFALIKAHSDLEENLMSIHNQETADEDLFFQEKKGAFLALYEKLGLDIAFFKASGKSALQTVLPDLPDGKTLLVHNTMTTVADLKFAQQRQDLFWCCCPNANLYIENRLPEIALWREEGLKITLGTDSLASNHQLSVLAEMRTLQEQVKLADGALQLNELLRWATINGAEFLGIAKQYGSFEKGKRPGINLVQGLENGNLVAATTIKRIDKW